MNELQLFIANVNSILLSEDVSVSEVARRAEIDRAELSRLLNGRVGCSMERAGKIARALGHPLHELIAGPLVSAK